MSKPIKPLPLQFEEYIILKKDSGEDIKKIVNLLELMVKRQQKYEQATIKGLEAILKQWPKNEQPTIRKMLEGLIREMGS